MRRILVAALAVLLVMVLGVAPSRAQKAYIPNLSGTVAVIDTVTGTVIGGPIAVGGNAQGVAVSPDGSKVYVSSLSNNAVSVIATAANAVTATIPLPNGSGPLGLAVSPDGSEVYVANIGSNTVSVIATASNTVIKTIAVGNKPSGVAVTPNGTAYVANFTDNTVSVISNNAVIKTITGLGNDPEGVAVSPDGNTVYVANNFDGTVSVIQTSNNTVVGSPITVGPKPVGVAVSPDGKTVYVVNSGSNNVSVIATATNKVIGSPITVGVNPQGVAVTPDGSKVYVANAQSSTISVIATATSAVTSISGVGSPIAFGNFIGPATLTVAVNGNGTVTSTPPVINCGNGNTQCSDGVPNGVSVSLTATAAAGSSFTGWSGGGCSGTGPCVVAPTVDTTVTATFTANVTTAMLTVSPAGNGGGTVTSTPAGINCHSGNGPACSASFTLNTPVTLVAVADSDSTFAGWSSKDCVGVGNCLLDAGGQTVTATFVANTADANVNLLAAVLPTSRSVQAGNLATAFATIINAGSDDASTCTIAPATTVAVQFAFFTTDPTTNALTSQANIPVTIPGHNGLQTFLIELTPTMPFNATDVGFTFTCANAKAPAVSTKGVNTLTLSASTTPVPDIIALGGSADPGYADLSKLGVGVFAVATDNIGSADNITVAANTGGVTLPVTLLVCQTDPTSGVCTSNKGAASASVTTMIKNSDTPTFGIFIDSAGAAIADNPAVNRAFVTFTDSTGALRGETSVAIRTH